MLPVCKEPYGIPSNLQLSGNILVASDDNVFIKTREVISPKRKSRSKLHRYHRVPVLHIVQKSGPVEIPGSLLLGGNGTVPILNKFSPTDCEPKRENNELNNSEDSNDGTFNWDGNCSDISASEENYPHDEKSISNITGYEVSFTEANAEIGSSSADVVENLQPAEVNSWIEDSILEGPSQVTILADGESQLADDGDTGEEDGCSDKSADVEFIDDALDDGEALVCEFEEYADDYGFETEGSGGGEDDWW